MRICRACGIALVDEGRARQREGIGGGFAVANKPAGVAAEGEEVGCHRTNGGKRGFANALVVIDAEDGDGVGDHEFMGLTEGDEVVRHRVVVGEDAAGLGDGAEKIEELFRRAIGF